MGYSFETFGHEKRNIGISFIHQREEAIRNSKSKTRKAGFKIKYYTFTPQGCLILAPGHKKLEDISEKTILKLGDQEALSESL